jgi:lysophospholipase L1-like esterase
VSPAARRRAAAGLELAALAVLAGMVCARPPARLLLVGDSITANRAAEPQGPGYGTRLQEQLGPGYEIVDVACSGSSSRDWRPDAGPAPCPEAGGTVPLYAARARPALPADVAIILLGTNDLRGAFELAPVEPDAYGENLRALVDTLHADGARALVLLSPPFLSGAVRRLAAYRLVIRALCQERPFVRCGPDLVALLRADDFTPPGDVHPNGAGHAKIAAALLPILRELAPR